MFSRLFSVIGLGLLLGNTLLAQQQAPRHPQIIAVPANTPITLDGKADEWDLSGSIDCVYEPSLAPTFSAKLALMYDQHAIYLYTHVVDDSPMLNVHDPKVNPNFAWDADAIQLRLTADPDMPYPVKATSFQAKKGDASSCDDRIVHLTLWHYAKEQLSCLRIQHGMDYHGDTLLLGSESNVVYRMDDDGQGYSVEASMPWTLLGVKGDSPKPGSELAFTIQYLFGNNTGQKQRLNFNDVVTGSAFHFQTAEKWGKLILSPTGKLSPAQSLSNASAVKTPLTIQLPVADTKATQISSAIYDADGKHVRTLPILTNPQITLENGQSAVTLRWDGADDLGQSLAAGGYTIKLLSHRGVDTQWVTSLHNAGNPPWKTDDGTGSWGGDHGSPICAASDDQRIYLGWGVSEAGTGIIAIENKLDDQNRPRKLWGVRQVLDLGIHVQAMASNGLYLFVAQDGSFWGRNPKDTQYKAGVVIWDAQKGRPVNFDFGSRLLIFSDWDSSLSTGMGIDRFNLIDIALAGDLIYGSLRHENKVVAMNWKTGEKHSEFHIPKPAGLTVTPDGMLWVASDNSLLKVDPSNGKQYPIKTNLDAPYGVDSDKAGHIYVSENGTTQQVKIYSSNGELLNTIGKRGGRPLIGHYDPSGILMPANMTIAPDGNLWVPEVDNSPRRISVWSTMTGKLQADLQGPGAYAVDGEADVQRPNWVNTHKTLYEVDYKTGQSKTVATLIRRATDKLQFATDHQDRRLNFRHVNGRSYLVHCGRGSIYVFLFDEKTLSARPVALIANTPGNKPLLDVAVNDFPVKDQAKVAQLYKQGMLIWTDRNGDSEVQVDEMVSAMPPDGLPSMYWGPWVDDDLSIWTGTQFHKGAIYRIPVESWLDDGTPCYPAPDTLKAMFNVIGKDRVMNVMPTLDRNSVLVIEQTAKRNDASDAAFEAVSRYDLSGNRLWAYRQTWTHFGLESPLFKPGYVIGAMKFIGQFQLDNQVELMGVNGYFGQFNLLTADGLWVGALGRDNRYSPSGSDKTYQCENFSGFIFRNKDDGQYYLIAGETDTRVSRITGLEHVKTGSMSLQITDDDYQRSLAATQTDAQESSQETPRSMPIVRIENPVMQPDMKHWPMDQAVLHKSDESRQAKMLLGYDDHQLYAVFDVTDASPMQNAGGDPAMLFKTGDSVNLYLGTDLNADASRQKPVAGDTRLLITMDQDKPVVVMYQTIASKGSTPQPRRFSSSTGSITFERVVTLQTVKVNTYRRDNGYTLVAAIPIEVLGMKLKPGMKLRGDMGVLYSNPGGSSTTMRSMFFNPHTQITQDIPSEARLEPAYWGTFEVK